MPSSPSQSQADTSSQPNWERIRRAYDPLGGAKAQIRRNQLLPLNWKHLTDGDLWEISKCLWDEPTSDLSEVEFEAKLAIAAILTTGRNLGRLHALNVYSNKPHIKAKGREGLVLKDGKFTWYLIAGSPKRQKEMKQASEDGSASDVKKGYQKYKTAKSRPRLIDINERKISFPTAPIVSEWLKRCGFENLKGQARLFKNEIEPLTRAIESILTKRRGPGVAPPRRCSRTLESITRYLMVEMTYQAGADIATAARLTDSNHPLSESPIHYGVSRTRDPSKRMRKATTRLNPKSRLCPPVTGEEQWLGSHLAPTNSQVRVLIGQLANNLQSSETLEEQHSAMVTQTVALIGFATGHRCLGEHLPGTIAIDECTRFCRVNEKFENDRSEVRMVWICEEARSQIVHYEQHIEALKLKIPSCDFEVVQAHLAVGKIPIFTLESDRANLCTMKSIWSSFHTQFPDFKHFVWNAGRHWLRSNLEGKCSTETLHAMFGHWQIGGEPWSYGSCFDPLLFRADLERTIPTLLDEIGWKALPSPLVTSLG